MHILCMCMQFMNGPMHTYFAHVSSGLAPYIYCTRIVQEWPHAYIAHVQSRNGTMNILPVCSSVTAPCIYYVCMCSSGTFNECIAYVQFRNSPMHVLHICSSGRAPCIYCTCVVQEQPQGVPYLCSSTDTTAKLLSPQFWYWYYCSINGTLGEALAPQFSYLHHSPGTSKTVHART